MTAGVVSCIYKVAPIVRPARAPLAARTRAGSGASRDGKATWRASAVPPLLWYPARTYRSQAQGRHLGGRQDVSSPSRRLGTTSTSLSTSPSSLPIPRRASRPRRRISHRWPPAGRLWHSRRGVFIPLRAPCPAFNPVPARSLTHTLAHTRMTRSGHALFTNALPHLTTARVISRGYGAAKCR